MFFSATDSTKTIAKEISIGTGIEEVIDIDLTLPKDRKGGIFISKDDLFLISLPVYVGVIPFMIGVALLVFYLVFYGKKKE